MTEPVQAPPPSAVTPTVLSDDDIRNLAAVLGKSLDVGGVTITKGVVVAFNLGGSPPDMSIQLNGDTSTTIGNVRFLDSYTPTVGDTVLIAKQGSDIFAVGQIAASPGSDNGWQTPSLNSGYSTNGNSNGSFQFRVVVDHGERKLQFRGAVAITGTPSTTICTLPVGARPTDRRTVVIARDVQGGSNTEVVDINTDGTIIRWGSTTAPTSSNASPGTSSFDIQHYHLTYSSNGGPYEADSSGIVAPGGAGGQTAGGANPHSHTVNSHNHANVVANPTWVGFNGLEIFL